MIVVRTPRGRWRFTKRECVIAIAILDTLEQIDRELDKTRIRKKELIAEMAERHPDIKFSNTVFWQLCICGFLRLSKCIFRKNDYNVTYYRVGLTKNRKYGAATIREDVNRYFKYLEELENESLDRT